MYVTFRVYMNSKYVGTVHLSPELCLLHFIYVHSVEERHILIILELLFLSITAYMSEM